MMKWITPLLALVPGFFGHDEAAIREVRGPTQIGKTAYFGTLKVQPLKILEDSRCPPDLLCYWQGELKVRANLARGRWRQTLDLSLMRPVHVPGGMLTLTGAERPADAGVMLAFEQS